MMTDSKQTENAAPGGTGAADCSVQCTCDGDYPWHDYDCPMYGQKMEHIVRFEGGFDCIRFECIHGSKGCKPGSGGSHGRHGLSIRFVSKGDKGAVQFLLYTGLCPQHAVPSTIGVRDCDWGGAAIPADLGYHAKQPQYDGQEATDDACEFCDGQPCYYDGSGLNANDAMYALVNGGGDALWAFLDAYYAATFDETEYPAPAEFKMPLRKANANLTGKQKPENGGSNV